MLIGDTGPSTWASRNVSPVTGPVPPTAPVEMPPSTPLPLKSAALNRSFRLTGGISLGISVGGMTVWNPRGGGLAVTIASGGGVSGGGGGGDSGGVRRNLVVSCRIAFIVSAAPAVALTAPYPSTRCRMRENTDCLSVRAFLGLDSIRFSNMALPPRESTSRR